MNPRDVIAHTVAVAARKLAELIEQELLASGHTIVGPADMEKAVEAGADALEKVDFPRGLRPFGITGRKIIAGAVLTAASTHMPVPAGWVLVPEISTNGMDVAGVVHLRGNPQDASGCYEAMLSAAPKPAQEKTAERGGGGKMATIKSLSRTVYFAPTAGRHFFTRKAAINREASAMIERKYPTERMEHVDGFCTSRGFHWRDDARLIRVHSRLTRRIDRAFKAEGVTR
jgi:hypothetical protein